MKLQLALDLADIEETIKILEEVNDLIDIVEIGTPFIIREGVHPVRIVKEAFPNITVLADLKIMDGGEIEASSAFEAGADIVTVLGVAEDATIKGVVSAAKKFGRETMADMIAIPDITERALQLDHLGLDYLCVHTAFDVQSTGKNPLGDLKKLKSVIRNSKAAVAGGINMNTLPSAVDEEPEIIIVGGALTNSTDIKAAAAEMRKVLH